MYKQGILSLRSWFRRENGRILEYKGIRTMNDGGCYICYLLDISSPVRLTYYYNDNVVFMKTIGPQVILDATMTVFAL